MVDTSVLIDGRIISIARSGFISGALIVPRSVVAELQYMADNADHDKRTRARYGLDVIQELQQLKNVTVQILQDGKTNDVDTQLVELAKKYSAELCTIDYNLNKVAQVEGVVVLNVNELAQALRATYLPGERRMLELVQRGSDAHQAVGYLEDGTMVVVEHSNSLIGQAVEIEFTRVLQTQAGKMMFAKRVDQLKAKQAKSAYKPVQRKGQQSEQQKAHKQPDQKDRVQKQQQPQSKPSTQKAPVRQQQSSQKRPSRKKTHEDALVELANRSNDTED
jgi:rRNA-processing protein FCF1